MSRKTVNASRLVEIKIKLLHIFMLLLLTVLIFSITRSMNFGIFLIYVSMYILLLHFWLGAYYVVKFLKSKENIQNYILDVSILICLSLGVINFYRIIIWGIWFALLFTLVLVKYRSAYLSFKEGKIKRYIAKKIRNEFVVPPAYALFAGLAYVFHGNDEVILSLQISILFFHVFFAVWMIFIKKAYLILSS
ncbi:MAG TPA: hypothetical protein VJJ52_02880 [Candidatus Nanoarchaeia archaeon]|nr:hypothetical protein [Candidatus Nanoarchaeia archaeon]